MITDTRPLYLKADDFAVLLGKQGPSLGLWRAAEVAALREQEIRRPVLDLGCGDGLVTSLVLRQVETGLDPDRRALARAAACGVYAELVARPMEQASLPPGKVGAILSNSVLEHIPNLDAVLQAAFRALRPGGRLIFTAPTEAFSRWLALPSAGYAAQRNRRFAHINLWPVDVWARRLEAAGFEIELVRPYLRRSLVAAWDLLELVQHVRIARRGLFGPTWQRLPPGWVEGLAQRAARIDLSAPEPGGGRLIVAVKR